MLTTPSHRHYRNAPITEAIIDLRVELPAPLPPEALRQMHAGEEQRYPKVEGLQTAYSELQLGPEVRASATSTPIGFLIRSADDKQIFQARTDGFSFSRLAPYPSWDEFRAEAYRLWSLYRDVARPSRVSRIAVRTINRLDIPLPLRDFSEYLRTMPQVSSDLPQALSGYFMQITMPLEEVRGAAVINEAIVGAAKPDVVSVVVDIDVFRTDELPADDAAVWSLFDNQLRHVKDNLFEGCITPKARRLFE